MNKKVLNYINLCEKWKVQIKEIHWRAKNLSQHKLCDDIASAISDFEDLVSEVEQSINGNIKKGELKPENANDVELKPFVEDVISSSQAFLKELEGMGDKYIGVKSECETFIGTMQRNLYLVNFTLKEELKKRLADRINEGYRKEENIKTTFHGTKPSTEKGLLKRINDITKNGQLNTRTFGGVTDALDFYRRILGKIGSLRSVDACEGNNYVVKLETEGGLSYYGLMRIKEVGEGQCKASITFSPHSDESGEVDQDISEPTLEDDYNAEMNQNSYGVKENRFYELCMEGKAIRMTGNELHSLVKESVKKIIKEGGLYGSYKDFAFKNAKDLEDFDRLKKSAEIEGEEEAELAQDNHNQTNNNFWSHEWVNGNLDLDDLENGAKW
jgi:hypothetical protein